MKTIKLTQGKTALIDDSDFELVSKHKWYAAKMARSYYAMTRVQTAKGQRGLPMHALILGKKEGFEIDHINHDSLNNTRSNLRHVTIKQNQYNRRKNNNGTSIYKGVCFYKTLGKWQAQIQKDGVAFYLGRYPNEKDAALAYNKAAIAKFGKLAHINKF